MDQKQVVQSSEDEIDLFELWDGLVQERLTIILMSFICMALAVVYLLMAPKQYEVKAELSPPLASEMSSLNYLDVTRFTPEIVYQAFLLNISPRVVAERLLKDPDVLELFDTTEKSVLIKNITNAITVVLPEESKKKLLVETGLVTGVIVNMPQAEDALTFANIVLSNTNKITQQQLLSEQVKKIKTQLMGVDRNYNLTLLRLKNENNAEIERLISDDNQKKSKLTAEIDALRVKAEQKKQFRIKRLESDFQLAKILNIQKPMDPLDYKLTSNNKTRIELKGNSPSRYWIGVTILDAEIKSLKFRVSNDPFIAGLTELKSQLALLDVNHKVNMLKERTNFIPFSSDLRALQTKKGKLLNALNALQDMEFNSYRIVASFVKPTHSVKPKKVLVLMVSAVLGLMLGIFIALIRRATKKRQELRNATLPTV